MRLKLLSDGFDFNRPGDSWAKNAVTTIDFKGDLQTRIEDAYLEDIKRNIIYEND